MRLVLPPRVLESSPIFRDIEGLGGLYEVKSGASAPEALRVEGGVLLVHDLQETLATQVAEIDVVNVQVVVPGANTTTNSVFSFPTMTDLRTVSTAHRILSAQVRVTALSANYAGSDFRVQPFGDPSQAIVALADAANLISIGGLPTMSPWSFDPFPLWGKRTNEYTFEVRSGAGGGTTAVLQMVVALIPQGVAVPR